MAASLSGWFIRDGKLWIRPMGVRLPKLCVATGQAAKGEALRRKGKTDYPAIPIAGTLASTSCIFGSFDFNELAIVSFWLAVGLGIVLSACLSKSFDFEYYVGDTAANQHWWRGFVARSLTLAGIVAFIAAAATETLYEQDGSFLWLGPFGIGLACVVASTIGYIFAYILAPRLNVGGFDGHHFRIKGARASYLAALAKLPGAAVLDSTRSPPEANHAAE